MANPYAAVADVQALLSTLLVIGPATAPSTAQVQTFLDQTAAEINGVLAAQGYTSVPATGANDLLLIGGFVAEKSAAKTWHAAFQGTDSPDNVQSWEKGYADFLNRLRQGQQHLVDQAPAGEGEAVFGIVRHPTRDSYFTERLETEDWDE